MSTVKQKGDILLIGPVCAGKTTQAALISAALGIPQISIDRYANELYDEYGFGMQEFNNLYKSGRKLEAREKRKPALLYAVEKILAGYSHCVFDFGAGHSYFKDPQLFSRIEAILSPYPNVVLILPSPDLKQSVEIIRKRSVSVRNRDWIEEGYDFIYHWIMDKPNHKLSKITVYTENKSPELVRDEILSNIK